MSRYLIYVVAGTLAVSPITAPVLAQRSTSTQLQYKEDLFVDKTKPEDLNKNNMSLLGPILYNKAKWIQLVRAEVYISTVCKILLFSSDRDRYVVDPSSNRLHIYIRNRESANHLLANGILDYIIADRGLNTSLVNPKALDMMRSEFARRINYQIPYNLDSYGHRVDPELFRTAFNDAMRAVRERFIIRY